MDRVDQRCEPVSGHPILVAREGALAILTLNRPDRLNALDAHMTRELDASMSALIDDETVRAILLTGAGRGFCAGTDLQEGAGKTSHRGRDTDDTGGGALRNHINPMISRMRSAGKPIVAVVNGPAAGVGCSLALAADIVIAGRSASFIQAFVRVGAVPDAGSTWFLPRAVGAKRSLAMMMLGEPVTSDVALAWGLVNRVHDDSELATAGFELGRRLAAGPTLAYALLKRCVSDGEASELDEQLVREAEAQDIAFSSLDRAEGFSAFIERRRVSFLGK